MNTQFPGFVALLATTILSAPNVCRDDTQIAPIVVNATLTVAGAILIEASLSFLGLGIQPPQVDLGSLIASGEGDATTLPWLFYFPAAFLVLAILVVNFIGDGLRDALDPTQRGR